MTPLHPAADGRRLPLRSLCLLLVLPAMAAWVGCGGGKDRVAPPEKEPHRIVLAAPADAFWSLVGQGAAKAAAEANAHVVRLRAPTTTELLDPGEALRQALKQGADAVLLAPDASTTRGRLDERALWIVLPGAAGASGDGRSLVAGDHREMGLVGAVVLGGIMEAQGRAVLLRGGVDGPGVPEREEAFQAQIQLQYPDIELATVDRLAAAALTEADAARQALELLGPADDSAQGVFCPDAATTLAMLQVLEESGRAGRVTLVGCGVDARLAKAIARGAVHALVVVDPFNIGHEAVKAAAAALDGTPAGPPIAVRPVLVLPDTLDKPEIRRIFEAGPES